MEGLVQDGILASLPYISMAAFMVPAGFLSDWLTTGRGGKGAAVCSVGAARKAFNALGVGVPALSLVWLASVGCDVLQAAAAMCVCLGSNGLIYGGLFVRTKKYTRCCICYIGCILVLFLRLTRLTRKILW